MSDHISTFDRTFLWRILYNNVFLGNFKGNDYVQLVIENLVKETHTHSLPWILAKTTTLISYQLDGAEKSQKLMSALRHEIEIKLGQNMTNLTLRNILLDKYIAFANASDKQERDSLVKMASEMVVPKFAQHKSVINKVQRYACIRALASASQDGLTSEIEDLIKNEAAIDFSAQDGLERIKIEAACSTQANKQAIWDKYVHPSTNYKQQDFIASAQNFWNKGDSKQCKHFANLWIDSLSNIEDTKHYDYFKQYMLVLTPGFLGDKDHKDRL